MSIIRKNRMRLLGLSLLFSVVVLGLWLLNVNKVEVARAEWFDEAWRYRRAFTIDQTKIDADLTDFPVAVNLLQRDWRTNIDYTKTRAQGADIRFTDASGALLPYEIEKWDTTATSTVWVKLPKVNDKTDTVFYVYYGNPSASDNQTPNEVWDANYKGVWHLDEGDSTAANFYQDSTSNANHGTLTDANGNSVAATGKVGGAFDFNGDADYIKVNDSPSLSMGDIDFTISAWVYLNATAPDLVLVTKYTYNTPNREWALFARHSSSGTPKFWIWDAAQSEASVAATSFGDPSLNTWHYIVARHDAAANTISISVNAGSIETTATSIGSWDSAASLLIGSQNEGSDSFIKGRVDDVRISKVARSAAWIKADYNSTNDTLLTYGAQEIGPGPSGWWRFDEGFGTTAYNSGSATGTDAVISGTTWQSEDMCVSGRCLYFDGTDDVVTVTEHPPINLSTHSSTTIEAWFKPASTGESDVGQMVQKGTNTYIRVSAGTSGMNIDASLDLATTDATLTINNAVATSTWAHIALVYDDDADDEIDMYVNGVLRGSSTNGAGSLATDNNNLLVGGTTTANFHGFIDEVKIYPYARTAAQIKTDYNSRGASKGVSARIGNDPRDLSDALQLYLKMDETQQNTCTGGVNDACDSSGAGRNGAWTGNATSTSAGKFGPGTTYDGTGDYTEVSDFDL